MKKLFFIVCIITSILSAAIIQLRAHFVGKVVAEWLEAKGGYRDMKLTKDFAFVDAKGKVWSAPAGTVVNGASIPRMLWTLVGSPYTGAYRDASVVHDRYCDTKDENWYDVHRMFYEACLTDGLDIVKSKMMYAAVYAAGPRWVVVKKKIGGPSQKAFQYITVPVETFYSENDIIETQKWIKDTNPSVEEIEKRLKPLVKQEDVKWMSY